MKKYEFWFLVGSQFLYGEDTLKQVGENAAQIEAGLNASGHLPFLVHLKPVVKTDGEITDVIKKANNHELCAGIITWMHTFSPSKMWIHGLSLLKKPYLHINTQFNRDIPFGSIDMDFMNANQSAHGDREHGFIGARMRLRRKVIAGYWQEEAFQKRIGAWMRSAAGYVESQNIRVLRISDNMREVAVTEGDKVEAHIKLGWSVDHYGVGDILSLMQKVSRDRVDAQMEEYLKHYDMVTDNIEAVRYQAKIQIALENFMEEKGYNAFTTNFQDLQGMEQLPGLAVQDLMRKGYGFGGEGDWKTAAMTRVMRTMAEGLAGGTGFMEDYTYHLEAGKEMVLGAHMLEVSPDFSQTRPQIQVHPLGIGDRNPPARLVFQSGGGDGVLCSLIDMGNRFRMVVNDVTCLAPEKGQEMPKLPVAGVFWKPLPDMYTACEAWILAGGAHHSTLSYALNAGHLRDYAEIMGIEFIHIGAQTDIDQFMKELRWNEAYYR